MAVHVSEWTCQPIDARGACMASLNLFTSCANMVVSHRIFFPQGEGRGAKVGACVHEEVKRRNIWKEDRRRQMCTHVSVGVWTGQVWKQQHVRLGAKWVKKNRICVRRCWSAAKERTAGTREKDRNLIWVQILCLCGRCGGDGEQQPRQCGGTSFISAHLGCSHSSLTPLTDELQRLAKLPADSALTHAPSTPSALPLCRYLALTLFPAPRI